MLALPFYIGPLHPHLLFETLGYVAAGWTYRHLRRRGDHLSDDTRGWIVVAAILGGLVGARAMYVLSDPAHGLADVESFWGGKSVVGGLLGALVAVEWTKLRLGVRRATGDLFALPAAIGIAIGRIGCFLTGLGDRTHGLPSSLPWAVDYGDGVPRHPTQLYEILFLTLLAPILARWRPARQGDTFKLFLASYLSFRLGLEALKPGLTIGGLTAIQWASLAGVAYYAGVLLRRRLEPIYG